MHWKQNKHQFDELYIDEKDSQGNSGIYLNELITKSWCLIIN